MQDNNDPTKETISRQEAEDILEGMLFAMTDDDDGRGEWLTRNDDRILTTGNDKAKGEVYVEISRYNEEKDEDEVRKATVRVLVLPDQPRPFSPTDPNLRRQRVTVRSVDVSTGRETYSASFLVEAVTDDEGFMTGTQGSTIAGTAVNGAIDLLKARGAAISDYQD